ncbi:MAG: UDP-N-acetylmuramate dehydrogenase [Actinomycetota bacterium]
MRTRTEVPFAELTTLRLGGPARRLVVAETEADLVAAVRAADHAAAADQAAPGGPALVLGGGSNLVVADAGVEATVVQVATRGVQVRADGDVATLTVAAGEPWDDLVRQAVAEGWSGVEALVGIPGLVGATPVQNVGAYGQEVGDCLARVRVLDRRRGTVEEWPAAACGLGYRTSVFKRTPGRWVVLAVTLVLPVGGLGRPIRYAELARALGVAPGAAVPLAEVAQAVLGLRRAKGMVLDPADPDACSAGSFFTNPLLDPAAAARLPPDAPRWPQPDGRVKTSAAWLIERAGFAKGYGDGAVRISTKHPLALTHRGGGSTAELVALAREVRDGVRRRFGVTLEPEPVLVGVHL